MGLSTLISGTVHLISGAVRLINGTVQLINGTVQLINGTGSGQTYFRFRLKGYTRGEPCAGRDLLLLCAALVGTDSMQKRTHALDLFWKQTNRTA